MKIPANADNKPANFQGDSGVFCPVDLTLRVFAGKWKLLLLWHLRHGPKRFGELIRAIPTSTRAVLSQHLKELEQDGIIVRQAYAQVPPKVEYSLSDWGASLLPLIAGLEEWGIVYAETHRQEQRPQCRWGN